MVRLSLSSTKGNSGRRYFPCSGYLGLTPVRAEGVVRTRLEDDQKPLQAKSITISIRCYEIRTRVATNYTSVLVDYTQVLWSKQDGVDYEAIGDLEFPFRISIPAKVAGFSNAAFVDYKCMWRIEAVLNHIPISAVGCRQVRHFDLSLVRYDVPSWLPLSSNPEPTLDLETNKPRAPKIRYSVHSPKTAIGPMDLVSIPLHLQPIDQDVSIRSASVVVERRITLNDNPTPSTVSSLTPPAGLFSKPSDSSLNRSSSSPRISPASSTRSPSSISLLSLRSESEPTPSPNSPGSTITPNTFYPPTSSNNPQSSSKVVMNPIADAQSSGSFIRDRHGVFSKTLTLQWPCAKSRARWAVGETITSELVSVKFFLRTKITVVAPSGTETIELAEKELYIVSTNETERQLAVAKYNEMLETFSVASPSTRSKSKSPRRTKDETLPSPVFDFPKSGGVQENSSLTVDSSIKPTTTRSGKSNRRPHTSAGPSDKPVVHFAGDGQHNEGGIASVSGSEQQRWAPLVACTPGSGTSTKVTQSKRHSETSMKLVMGRARYIESCVKGPAYNVTNGAGIGSSKPCSGIRMDTPSISSSTSTTTSSWSASSSGHSSANTSGDGDSLSRSSDNIREWEEELARIEARSKESSILFACTKKRKKSIAQSHSNVVTIVASDEP